MGREGTTTYLGTYHLISVLDSKTFMKWHLQHYSVVNLRPLHQRSHALMRLASVQILPQTRTPPPEIRRLKIYTDIVVLRSRQTIKINFDLPRSCFISGDTTGRYQLPDNLDRMGRVVEVVRSKFEPRRIRTLSPLRYKSCAAARQPVFLNTGSFISPWLREL